MVLLRYLQNITHAIDAFLYYTQNKTHTANALFRSTYDRSHKTDAMVGFQGVTVFGTYEKGIGFNDGSQNPVGLEPWIEIIVQIGASPIDVTVSYVDQDGNPETTTVSTSIPSGSTVGTQIKVVLNTGDQALRDITNITISGGTNGDKFKIRSLVGGYWGKPQALINKVYDGRTVDDLSGNEYSKHAMPALVRNPPFYYPVPNPQMRPFIAFVRRN